MPLIFYIYSYHLSKSQISEKVKKVCTYSSKNYYCQFTNYVHTYIRTRKTNFQPITTSLLLSLFSTYIFFQNCLLCYVLEQFVKKKTFCEQHTNNCEISQIIVKSEIHTRLNLSFNSCIFSWQSKSIPAHWMNNLIFH